MIELKLMPADTINASLISFLKHVTTICLSADVRLASGGCTCTIIGWSCKKLIPTSKIAVPISRKTRANIVPEHKFVNIIY